jgi:hypothetical protein
MIKEYIEAKYGFKVHTAYIAEVKRDLGFFAPQPPLLWLRELWKTLRRYLSPGNVPMAQREEEPSWLNINW